MTNLIASAREDREVLNRVGSNETSHLAIISVKDLFQESEIVMIEFQYMSLKSLNLLPFTTHRYEISVNRNIR